MTQGQLVPNRNQNKKPMASCMCWFPGVGDTRRGRDRENEQVVATLGYQNVRSQPYKEARRGISAPGGAPKSRVPEPDGTVYELTRDTSASKSAGLAEFTEMELEAVLDLHPRARFIDLEQHRVQLPSKVANPPQHARKQSMGLSDDCSTNVYQDPALLPAKQQSPKLPSRSSSPPRFIASPSQTASPSSRPKGRCKSSPSQQADLEDDQIMDIPIEISPSPALRTNLLQMPPSMQSTTTKPNAARGENQRHDARTDDPQRAKCKAHDKVGNPAISAPGSRSPMPHCLPRVPVLPSPLSNTDATKLSGRAQSFPTRLSPLMARASNHSWASVEDSGDEGDWVRSNFDDPTVFIDASARQELEESHGFFSSSILPFSSSPPPQDRPSAKTSGSKISAASTNLAYGQSTANHEFERDCPTVKELSVKERWLPDGKRNHANANVANVANVANRRDTHEERRPNSGRTQSEHWKSPAPNGRPPSPCLVPGTLKNLTSAWENQFRKGAPDVMGRPSTGPRVLPGISLRTRIENELKMLSFSDDEHSSGGSSPREHNANHKSANDGLLC